MNRSFYYNYIDEKLHILSRRISDRSKHNLLEFNIHSEYFYQNFLNAIYDWKLKNLNDKISNIPGVDLIDKSNKIIMQVSATLTRQKIEHSLTREFLQNYSGYTFKFMSIVESNEKFGNKIFNNPYNLNFSPNSDILNINILLSKILGLNIKKLEEIYSICKDELENKDINMHKVHTNLADIVNILSREDFQLIEKNTVQNVFEIDKKIDYNNLNFSKDIIEDYKIFQQTIDNIYKEFDIQGKNRSYSILQIIKSNYITLCKELDSNDNDLIFLKLCAKIKERIVNSQNYKEIAFEELEICINILIVDAFMRCKIFKNPEGYNYAVT